MQHHDLPERGLSVGIFDALMPKDAATTIAIVGLFATLIGAAVALFNSWKAVCWKRAELANTYIKEFNSNDEMVFAGRCLDWEGGRLFCQKNCGRICRAKLNLLSTIRK